MADKIKILLLAANPIETTVLHLHAEVREISRTLFNGMDWEKCDVIAGYALNLSELQGLMVEHQPHIVQFCRVGNATDELLLKDNGGESKAVSKEALAKLFTININVRVVVLDGTFSKLQALALNEVIDFTVTINKEIEDKAAISFAAHFYRAFAIGCSVNKAFEFGRIAIDLYRPSGSYLELLVRDGADTSESLLNQHSMLRQRSVFISYNHRDKDLVQRLANDLKAAGLPCWWDQWEIKVGQSIFQKVSDGIDSSAYLIAVLSPNSVQSNWVQREIGSAIMKQLSVERGIIVLPLLAANCEVPVLLRDIKWADFRVDYSLGLKSLLDVLLDDAR